MTLNIADHRIADALSMAKLILEGNLTLSQISGYLDTSLEYQGHFNSWYGEQSAEYEMICALANLVRIVHLFCNTACSASGGGKSAGDLTFNQWLGDAPIRNSLRLRLFNSIQEQMKLTG